LYKIREIDYFEKNKFIKIIMQSVLRWPKGPVYLLVLSLLIFLLPSSLKGPVMFQLSEDNYLNMANMLAFIPLVVSLIWIQRGLWKRRIYLFNRVTMYPGATTLMIFIMGLGLGMLLAHAFSDFSYWWAIGGTIFIIPLVIVVLKSGRID
jgi:hypothetical protein